MGVADYLPYLEAGTGILGLFDQQRLEAEARTAEEQKFAEMMGRLTGLRGRAGRELEGLGTQVRSDIGKAFTAQRGAAQQNLVSRGLVGTTVQPGVMAGITSEETDAYQRLEESLARERMGVDFNITGSELGVLSSQSTEPGRSILLDLSQLINSLRPAPAAPEPPGTDYAALGIQGGAQLGSTAILAHALKAAAGGCLDAVHTTVETPDGAQNLGNIVQGDWVKNAEGMYREVIAVDIGWPKSKDRSFVHLITDGGPTIIATPEHVIEGRPAGEYNTGDTLGDHEITQILPLGYRLCGDILLSDHSEYLANDFRVRSMFPVDHEPTTDATD